MLTDLRASRVTVMAPEKGPGTKLPSFWKSTMKSWKVLETPAGWKVGFTVMLGRVGAIVRQPVGMTTDSVHRMSTVRYWLSVTRPSALPQHRVSSMKTLQRGLHGTAVVTCCCTGIRIWTCGQSKWSAVAADDGASLATMTGRPEQSVCL